MGTTTNGLPYPESTDFVTDGAQAIEDLATTADSKMGLWLIKSQNFATADPLDLTEIFTSKFLNYKIYLSYYGSADSSTKANFLSGTSTVYNTNNHFRNGFYVTNVGAYTGFAANNQTAMFLSNHGSTANSKTRIEMSVFSPNTTAYSVILIKAFDGGGSKLMIDLLHEVPSTTQFTGLRIDADSGSITGEVRVYGCRD